MLHIYLSFKKDSYILCRMYNLVRRQYSFDLTAETWTYFFKKYFEFNSNDLL